MKTIEDCLRLGEALGAKPIEQWIGIGKTGRGYFAFVGTSNAHGIWPGTYGGRQIIGGDAPSPEAAVDNLFAAIALIARSRIEEAKAAERMIGE